MKALITRKIGMTSTIEQDGTVRAVTLLSANPCVVTQIKNDETDGYSAVQIGSKTNKRLNKPQTGHVKSAKIMPSIISEVHLAESTAQNEDLAVGKEITAEVFSVGDNVKVTAASKGKGWAGTIKKHSFRLGNKTHGGRSYRRPGSIGSMYPQKIFKGKKMAGRMGNRKVTTRNLKIAIVDTDNKVLGVTGAVPGPRKGIVLIQGISS